MLAFTCLIGWPLVGFMVGSITGDPTAWHQDQQIVKLCSRLTWLLVAPCLLRVAVQAPIWLAGNSGSMDPDTAVAALGVLKIALGWPLQLAALGVDDLAALAQPHARRAGRSDRLTVGAQPWCWVGREQPLELVSTSAGTDEQQLVAGLQRLLGLGRVDLPVAQDRHERAVVGERHQAGGRADVGRVG